MAEVRIKVLIDVDGKYCGYGWNNAESRDIDDTLYDVVYKTPLKEYWITADLPLPETEEIKATIIA